VTRAPIVLHPFHIADPPMETSMLSSDRTQTYDLGALPEGSKLRSVPLIPAKLRAGGRCASN